MDLGFRDIGFRDLGFRDLGFRDSGFRVSGSFPLSMQAEVCICEQAPTPDPKLLHMLP